MAPGSQEETGTAGCEVACSHVSGLCGAVGWPLAPGGNRKVGISISSPRDLRPIDPPGLPRLVGRLSTPVCTFFLASLPARST